MFLIAHLYYFTYLASTIQSSQPTKTAPPALFIKACKPKCTDSDFRPVSVQLNWVVDLLYLFCVPRLTPRFSFTTFYAFLIESWSLTSKITVVMAPNLFLTPSVIEPCFCFISFAYFSREIWPWTCEELWIATIYFNGFKCCKPLW